MVNHLIISPDFKEVKKLPKTTKFKIYVYVQNERNQIYESFYLIPDKEHDFSTSYLHEEPILDRSNIK